MPIEPGALDQAHDSSGALAGPQRSGDLRRWVRQHERDNGQREGSTTAEAKRIKDLEREVRELRKANEILKLASAFFAQAELDHRFKL
jgi:transposase-like protein